MSISKIVLYAVVTAAGWMAFGFASREFLRLRTPRANVVRGVPQMVNGHRVVIADPTKEEMDRADLSLPFMTAETFAFEMESYQRRRAWAAGLAICFCFVTAGCGSRLGESWLYGIACVIFGPLAVSYVVYRSSRAA